MAIEDCLPCGCIPPNIGNDKFKQDVELILCAILAATAEPVTTYVGYEPYVEMPYADITNAYENTGLQGGPWKGLHITNETDGIVSFVFGNQGADPQVRVVSSETRTLSFNGSAIHGGLYIRFETEPTQGNVYIEAFD